MQKIMERDMPKKQKIYAGILAFCLILGLSICYGVTTSRAAALTTGTVNTNSGSLNVRNGPATTYSVIGALAKGTQVTILGEEGTFYKIQYGSGEGYVSKDYIANVQTVDLDAGYVEGLMAQGFPASYANALSLLHAQYPNWVFEPVVTGLDWNTVIEKESALGKNLVQASNNDAQKSTVTGAYNWATNTWIGYDGAGWVAASSEMIQYCMDPRNFMDDQNIFQFATNEYKDYQNASGVQALLAGTFMSGNYNDTDGVTKSYADTFVSVGSQLGVSPYHLASRCRQEQGTKGTSGSISGTVSPYQGYFNYFNIGAYPGNGLTSVQNGLAYAQRNGWNTRYASILGGASVVANNYVKKGQNTVYFEKFNVVVPTLYSHQYMTNVQAAISEGKNIKKAYTDTGAAIVFRIPVYNNMPETVCTLPSSGNPNNWISTLSVDGYALTPAFNPATTEYSLVVGENVSSINISAAPVVSSASISGTGTYTLEHGNNTITLTGTSQSGATRTYTILVARQGSAAAVTTSRGDINGDGKISNSDIVLQKRHILSLDVLSGTAFNAADVNGDGKVSNADIVLVKRHILGLQKIE